MAEYIERETAIAKIRAEGVLSGCCHGDEEIEKNVVDMLESIPAADVAPVVHGKWMGRTTSAYIGLDDVGEPKYASRIHFRCSKCRYGTVVKSAYCPSCGAKMEEVQ